MKNNNVLRIVNRLILLSSIVLAISCSTQKEVSPAALNQLKSRVNSEQPLKIEVTAAFPMNTFASQQVINAVMRNTGDTANRIDLNGDGHYLTISKEKVVADLPFYGERRQGGSGYNSNDTGISFDTEPKDYQMTLDEARGRYKITFDAQKDTESFDVEITLFANGTASVFISSVTRTRIEYQGTLESMSE